MGGPTDRQLLLYLAEDAKTVAPLRLHIRRALAATATQQMTTQQTTTKTE
jgi:hypothetical protein